VKKDHDQPPQHDEFALGEIDDLGHIIDDVKSHGHHGIDTAYGNAGDQVLKELP